MNATSPSVLLLQRTSRPQAPQAVPPAPSTDAPVAPSAAQDRVPSTHRGPLGWLDRMSAPRPSTQGDFDGPAWFQAGFQASVEGFYLGGLAASGGCLAASLSGLWIGEKTHSQIAACLTGATVAGGIMAAVASGGGAVTAIPAAITGGLLGAFVTFRGNAKSRVRDSAGNAAMLVGPFMHGPTKVAAGLGAGAAQKLGGSAAKQALVGAAVAGGLGAALAAVGYAPLGIAATTLVCGAAGAIGPFFGPRFSQFFRNASLELGGQMVKGAKVVGMKNPPSQRITNAMGAIPSSFVKEGVRGCILADFSPTAFLLGGIAESIQQMDIFLHQHNEDETKRAAQTVETGAAQPSIGGEPRLPGKNTAP